MSEDDRKQLVALIHKAFEKTPAPKNGSAGDELEDFNNKHWRDIPAKTVRRYGDEFVSFSPDGFRFFLPAILTAIILYPNEADIAVDNIITYLAPPEPDSHLKTRFILRLISFSDGEKAAIAQFLKVYRQLNPDGA